MTLISVKEAAALLGVTERAVRKRIEQGKLPVAEWLESNKGRGGKMAMLDRLFVEQLPVNTKEPTKEPLNAPADNSLIPVLTKEPTKEPVKPCMSLVPIKRNKRKKDSDLWLSFGEVLELYRVMAERSNCNTPRLECYKVQEAELISPTKEPLVDKKEGTKELPPCVSSKKIVDKTLPANFSIFDQKSKKGTKEPANLVDIFQPTNEPTENEKDWRSTPECRQLFRDINSGLLTTRKDPDDLRKTQILFNSLSAAYQSLWRLLRVPGVLEAQRHIQVGKAELAAGTEAQSDGIKIGPLTIYNNVAREEEGKKKQVTVHVKQQFMSGLEKTPQSQFWEVVDEFCNYYQTNRTTVWRWWSAYKQAGNALGVLERKRSAKLGRRSIDELPLHIKERFWYLVAAHPKRNCQNAALIIESEFSLQLTKRQIYELKSEKQGAIYLANLVQHYPQHARFVNYFTPQDRTKNQPLEVVTADGHDCDIFVIDEATGEPFRPVLVGIFDVASNITLGWALGKKENLSLVNMALIDAILKYGWFPNLKVDRGKAFWMSEERRRRIFDMLKISVISANGYSPHQKSHQERYFGEFERHVCMQLPGYLGNSVANRTRSTVSKDVKAVLTFDQFKDKVSYFFSNVMPHIPQGGLKGMTAAEFWKQCEDNRMLKLKMFPGDAKTLLKAFTIALGDQTAVTVRKSMVAFSYNGTKYFFHNPLLIQMQTERVEVIFNPNTLDNDSIMAVVYIFKNNRFLCEAEKIPLQAVGVVTETDLKRKIETKRSRKELLADPMWSRHGNKFLEHIACYKQVDFTPESVIADVSDTELDELMPLLEGKMPVVRNQLISDEVANMDIYAAQGITGMNELFVG